MLAIRYRFLDCGGHVYPRDMKATMAVSVVTGWRPPVPSIASCLSAESLAWLRPYPAVTLQSDTPDGLPDALKTYDSTDNSPSEGLKRAAACGAHAIAYLRSPSFSISTR